MIATLFASVLVSAAIALVVAALASLHAFEMWLAFRRERATGQPEGVAELVARVKALEEKATAEQLQKLRR